MKSTSKLKLYNTVKCGFPSPADDYAESELDLNEFVIKHPASTFFVKASGDSMIEAGISTGDILVVDKSIEASNGQIIVAFLNGEFTAKRYYRSGDSIILEPANNKYKSIVINSDDEFLVWGVVTFVIHKTVK